MSWIAERLSAAAVAELEAFHETELWELEPTCTGCGDRIQRHSDVLQVGRIDVDDGGIWVNYHRWCGPLRRGTREGG